MKTAELLREALIMHLKRWRTLQKLTQLQAAERLDIGRTVIAQDFSATKLETLLELWDRVGGSVAFTISDPREAPQANASFR
jgi:predicted XRE-type DNA-binding protein